VPDLFSNGLGLETVCSVRRQPEILVQIIEKCFLFVLAKMDVREYQIDFGKAGIPEDHFVSTLRGFFQLAQPQEYSG
jgi:hypothetical protein